MSGPVNFESNAECSSMLALVSTITECVMTLSSSSSNSQSSSGEFLMRTPLYTPGNSDSRQATLTDARVRLREACDELLYLANGPHEHLMTIAQAHRIEAALQYATHFNLAHHVPLGQDGSSSISFGDLASKSSVQTEQCTRIMRLLISCHIFWEPTAGCVAHTAASRLLCDVQIGSAVSYYTDESFRAASFLSEACEQWPITEERNHTALNLAFRTSLPKFEFFATEPWRARRFMQGMAGMAASERFSLEHLVDGFDWASLPRGATVIDIGGANGHASMAVAEKFPQLQFVVQDLKSAFNERELHDHLKSRVRFMEYDFYSPQPVTASVYILRWILHDYPDKYAVKILRSQLNSMQPYSRLLIMDGIMLSPGKTGKVEQRKARFANEEKGTRHSHDDTFELLGEEPRALVEFISAGKPTT
ncbi:uncharacterized protein JN550_005269 [Neoarthrinium moseri]|uniref:uncharacterized protein n=1 Tax=Neoarthrinium moseri TaxID=1658444 RepID=UPI001FDE87BB|nr:uncharacterized protein JN550_005269 [Neoarthrinium moseri]KAI1870341.1 hypothetical protein JN550_005269 [Neoarthrinium moseri]